ncbi:hypothetical protein RUM4293_01098 [Ruegeria atlantica]|uniref:Uncharacterized protein n=1 Tax=Ruegeria atlantica TaxID=81569 RepID=A0A0N7LNE7_9RHOB|nr:hypothetical protein RUM4293_01098 [Ruegeria atlantica]
MRAMMTRRPDHLSMKMRAWCSLGIFFQTSRTDFSSVIMLVSKIQERSILAKSIISEETWLNSRNLREQLCFYIVFNAMKSQALCFVDN